MQCICCIGGLVSALSSNVGFLDDDITKTAKWRRFMHVVVDVKSRMAAVESGAFFQNQTETSQALELRILTISKVKTKRGGQEKVYFIGVRYG